MMPRKRIGEMLIEAGLLTTESLEAAISAAREKNMKLGRYLVREGVVPERQVNDVLSKQLRIQVYVPDKFPVDAELARLIPVSLAAQQQIVPLKKEEGLLLVAMPDPTDVMAMDALQEKVKNEVEPVICTEEEFEELLGSLYGVASDQGGVPQDIETIVYGEEAEAETTEGSDLQALQHIAEGQAAVRNVDWILIQAVRNGASDIHISPEKDRVRLRMRVDGFLKELPALPKSMEASIVSRLKILSRMDISVRRRPQDGRMTARIGDREIHLRLSSLPTVHGENVVLRLLGSNAPVTSFEDLGMLPGDANRVTRCISRPNGLLLSTGPTGSGKTTTLYTVLSRLNRPEVNIVTVEDPVEYRMDRIRQVELNVRAGMTFASSLRTILRQDPDIIMVGEIRDQETAALAVQASLTGHLVLSTMHTNDALGAVSRLSDMGIEPFLVSSVLGMVIAQRLVRKLCPSCARPLEPSPEALAFWNLSAAQASEATFRQAGGCRHCRQSGYRGRVGLYEVLEVDEELRRAILHREDEGSMRRLAIERVGFRSLHQDAAEKVARGETSMEEAAGSVQASATPQPT